MSQFRTQRIDPSDRSTDSAADELTIEVGPGGRPFGDSSSTVENRRLVAGPPVEMIEGTESGLSGETLALLRKRLRLAAVLMFAAFLVFLPQHFFETDFAVPGATLLFGFHVAVTLVTGIIGARLCQRCQIGMQRLRAVELTVFGLAAAFFLAVEHFVVLEQSRELVMVRAHAECTEIGLNMPGGTWLLLIFTYALFIPNTFRRAAIVLGAIAFMPVALIVLMAIFYPSVREVASVTQFTAFPLMLGVAAVTAAFGVDTIGSLRREVHEARQLGQYRLKRRIGEGGMGEVYLAEHQLLKRPCVVKLIRPDKAGDSRVLARFQREVQSTARLTHWNTVEIFDYGVTADGTFYYVMEHLSGMSLGEIVARYGPMAPERVVYLMRQACDALREAHAMGLVHRDIKPANIFAARRGGVYDVVKLLDFGLVKPIVQEESPVDLTAEGSITGSPLFMSPEQATGDSSPDARSDIYSLGAVGYYLLAGRPPFEAERPIKVMIAHVRDEVVPPSHHRSDVPRDLEQVILKCLAKLPEDRYPNALSLAEALDGCEASDGWDRLRAAQWWRDLDREVVSV